MNTSQKVSHDGHKLGQTQGWALGELKVAPNNLVLDRPHSTSPQSQSSNQPVSLAESQVWLFSWNLSSQSSA